MNRWGRCGRAPFVRYAPEFAFENNLNDLREATKDQLVRFLSDRIRRQPLSGAVTREQIHRILAGSSPVETTACPIVLSK